MIKKFKKQFLYKTNVDSRIFGRFGYIEFFRKDTSFENSIEPTKRWQHMIGVPSNSILLLLEKINVDKRLTYRFFFLSEMMIIEMYGYLGSENNNYPYFTEITETNDENR